MLNKRTMNNSRHQHDQLDNCRLYCEHVDSIFPTPFSPAAATDRTRSLSQSWNKIVITWSTVDYTRYTRIIHCRPCYNVYLTGPTFNIVAQTTQWWRMIMKWDCRSTNVIMSVSSSPTNTMRQKRAVCYLFIFYCTYSCDFQTSSLTCTFYIIVAAVRSFWRDFLIKWLVIDWLLFVCSFSCLQNSLAFWDQVHEQNTTCFINDTRIILRPLKVIACRQYANYNVQRDHIRVTAT